MALRATFKKYAFQNKLQCIIKVIANGYSDASESKIYELRFYASKPQFFPNYKKLSEEIMHIRCQASKMIGYWFTEMGSINEAVHIWEYENFDHRTNVRHSLLNSSEWQKVIVKATPMFAHQNNFIMKKLPGFDIVSPLSDGVYDLRITQLSGLPKLGQHLSLDSLKIEKELMFQHGVTLIGAFSTLWGPQNSTISLWHGKDFSILSSAKEKLAQESHKELQDVWEKTMYNYSRALIPASFSPLK